jgi:hypothetical protein
MVFSGFVVLPSQAAVLFVPELTVDSRLNVLGSGFIEPSPVTFLVTTAFSPDDSIFAQACGIVNLASNRTGYRVNAAGVFMEGTTGYVVYPPSSTFRYGEVLIGNSEYGYHSLFPADSSTGVGISPVPSEVPVTRTLRDVFGPTFSGILPGTTLGLLIFDSDQRDNTGSLTFSPVPEPTSLAIWSTIALGGLGLAYRRRRKQIA